MLHAGRQHGGPVGLDDRGRGRRTGPARLRIAGRQLHPLGERRKAERRDRDCSRGVSRVWLRAGQRPGLGHCLRRRVRILVEAELAVRPEPAICLPLAGDERLAGNRRYRLVDRTLSTEARDGEVVSERVLQSARELGEVLRDTFSITPPVPAEEIFDRAGS